MSFIKRGDGKILKIIIQESLTDEQKESINDSSKELVEKDASADSLKTKKLEN